jgi:hypothetical protein
MCKTSEYSQGAQARQEGINSTRHEQWLSMRNELIRTPGACFEVRMQAGNVTAVQKVDNLGALIDMLCAPRQVSMSVDIILPPIR